jgi:hypothetical protein
MTEDAPWNGQCLDAAYEFAVRCAELASRKPVYEIAPLDFLINALMTELWDRNFSQSEIRAAFEGAVNDMPRYAGVEERRSSTSSTLATTDWRSLKT